MWQIRKKVIGRAHIFPRNILPILQVILWNSVADSSKIVRILRLAVASYSRVNWVVCCSRLTAGFTFSNFKYIKIKWSNLFVKSVVSLTDVRRMMTIEVWGIWLKDETLVVCYPVSKAFMWTRCILQKVYKADYTTKPLVWSFIIFVSKLVVFISLKSLKISPLLWWRIRDRTGKGQLSMHWGCWKSDVSLLYHCHFNSLSAKSVPEGDDVNPWCFSNCAKVHRNMFCKSCDKGPLPWLSSKFRGLQKNCGP